VGLRGRNAKPKKTARNQAVSHRRKRKSGKFAGLSRQDAVCQFIESLRITSGPLAGQPFTLRPWQREIIQSWYQTDSSGKRIVRTGLLSVGRKNGKTSICAALALCHLLGPETERRGQIVVGATDRDQSGLIFDELVAFIEDNPQFSAMCNIKRHEKVIENLENGSKFRSLSSDAKKAHGLSPSVVILDELAQWGRGAGRALYDALTTSQGARKEPLLLIIGTQSADDLSLMSQLVDYAKAVRSGSIEDPAFSGFVYEIPKDADVWDEANWTLANPALGDFRDLQDMRLLAERAKHMPTLEATFRNLFCNQRIDAEERWIPFSEWSPCIRDGIDLDELAGQRCIGGLDLGSVRDLTSFAIFWPGSGTLAVWSWCPADNLRAREDSDRVPYTVWAQRGYIEPTPGKATNKRIVALRIADICARFCPESIAFDIWGITELERILNEEGLRLPPFKPFGQGYKSMSPATKAFEELVLNKKLTCPDNALLTWAISNVILERDAAGNVKPSKEHSRERIDPAVAAIMAVGLAAAEPKCEFNYDQPLVITA
jgi:phage terminase large subunit-like protein